MTWQLVALIALLPICATVFACVSLIFTDSTPAKDMEELAAKVDKIAAEHETIHKLADETKKLLSQSNMAAGFLPRSMR